jgi:prepilin peptidase CpaA
MAAVLDLKFRRIPNWLTVTGLFAGVLLQAAWNGWAGIREAIAGATLAFVVYFALFALRAMGGGDVKLMTAVGAFAGPANWFQIFLIAAITGGILAVFLLLIRGTLLKTLARVLMVLGELLRLRAPYHSIPELDISHAQAVTLPHGVSIALGCLLFLIASTWNP